MSASTGMIHRGWGANAASQPSERPWCVLRGCPAFYLSFSHRSLQGLRLTPSRVASHRERPQPAVLGGFQADVFSSRGGTGSHRGPYRRKHTSHSTGPSRGPKKKSHLPANTGRRLLRMTLRRCGALPTSLGTSLILSCSSHLSVGNNRTHRWRDSRPSTVFRIKLRLAT
jgi:hypothetical protein